MRKTIGGVVGAVLLTLITTAYHTIVSPTLLSDGQYGMVLIFLTLPTGAILGVGAAQTWNLVKNRPLSAGGILVASVIVAALPLCGLIYTASSNPAVTRASVPSVINDALVLSIPAIVWLFAHLTLALGIITWGYLKKPKTDFARRMAGYESK